MFPENTWYETATGTDSGATATHAAAASLTHFVTHISGYSDADCDIQITANDDTVLWATNLDISVVGPGFSIPLPFGVFDKTNGANAALKGKISASTAACSITFGGYSV